MNASPDWYVRNLTMKKNRRKTKVTCRQNADAVNQKQRVKKKKKKKRMVLHFVLPCCYIFVISRLIARCDLGFFFPFCVFFFYCCCLMVVQMRFSYVFFLITRSNEKRDVDHHTVFVLAARVCNL
jgi:hypothetical protein